MHLFKRENGYYYVNLTNGKRVSTKKKKRSEALTIARIMQEKIDKDIDQKKTFGVYAEKFFIEQTCPWVDDKRERGHRLSSRWIENRRGHLVNWLLPFFSNTYLHEINSSLIKITLKNFDCSNTMKNKILDSLNIILNYALDEGYIRRNSVNKRLRYSEKVQRIRDAFTPDEIDLLFPMDKEKIIYIWDKWEIALFFATLAYTGMRPSEARALLWDDIENGCILIQKSFSDKNIGYTKTEAGIRAVPISQRLQWMFDRMKKKEEGFIFPSLLVSTRNSYLRPFKRALKRVEIDDSTRNLVPYSFRHTFNTIAFETMKEEDLRELMGHASSEMTMRYLHLSRRLRQERAIKKATAIHEAFNRNHSNNKL